MTSTPTKPATPTQPTPAPVTVSNPRRTRLS